MDIVEGKKLGRREYISRHLRTESNSGPLKVGDPPTMAVVHATNASDPFLLSWTKDTPNPIAFEGQGTSFPSEVWKNGDHWNFIAYGTRYTTKDPTFHTWGAAPGPKFINAGENGGQFFGLIANKADGTPPGPGAPTHMINIAGGNQWSLGKYNPTNESYDRMVDASIDNGPNANWMTGQFAGDRFMNIGWALGGPPMLKAGNKWKHVADYPNEDAEWAAHAAGKNGAPQPVTRWMNNTDMPGDDVKVVHSAAGSATFGPEQCQKMCDGNSACNSWTWLIRGSPRGSGDCCMHGDTGCPNHAPGMTSGAKKAGTAPCGRPPSPPGRRGFTHDHLTGLREVAYEPLTGGLISNPVRELVNLRNGSMANASAVVVKAGTPYVVAGTGAPADASTSDVVVNFALPTAAGASFSVTVLANVSGGVVTGGVFVNVSVAAADANGTRTGTATTGEVGGTDPEAIRGGGAATSKFSIFKGETVVDMRLLVDRSIVEAFIMGGRTVFTKTFGPPQIPDTNVVVEAAGADATANSVEVWSMGCGWTAVPYQPNPTMESISVF
jgi:hypothetical protein